MILYLIRYYSSRTQCNAEFIVKIENRFSPKWSMNISYNVFIGTSVCVQVGFD